MILLLLGNLAWMVFDWFFAFPPPFTNSSKPIFPFFTGFMSPFT